MSRYAAVDIGSNSVRMEVAETFAGNMPRTVASERQVVRLGESVFRTGMLSEESLRLLGGVLARMARRYRALGVSKIRAVATAALREAGNRQEFIVQASAALCVPVEIISGEEEARLIHLGVESRWPDPGGRYLIADVGGGSTEVILSDAGRIEQVYSLPLGALRLYEMFGESNRSGLEHHIREELRPALQTISGAPPDRVIGTSATAAAVVSSLNRISRYGRADADRLSATTREIRVFYEGLSALDLRGRRRITGIGPQRAEIIVPGTAILLHVVESLGMPQMFYSAGGVRDGIIAELAAS